MLRQAQHDTAKNSSLKKVSIRDVMLSLSKHPNHKKTLYNEKYHRILRLKFRLA